VNFLDEFNAFADFEIANKELAARKEKK